MEVFQSCGEEGVLTVYIDGNEPVKLCFKKKVQVSVSYKDDVIDTPHNLKTEALPLEDDTERKTDPLDEELNGIIERVKNNESRTDNLFPSAREDLFPKSNAQNLTPVDDDCDMKKICDGKDGNIHQGGEENDDEDDDIGSERAMGVDCDNFDGHEDDDPETLQVVLKPDWNLDEDGDGKREEQRGVKASEDNDKNEHIILAIKTPANEKRPDRNHDGKIISGSKKRSSSIGHRDDNMSKLVEEVAEKSHSIGRATSAAALLLRDRASLMQKGKLARTTCFKCHLCDKTFSDSYLLSMHQRAENTKAMCKACDLECMSTANLIIHEHLMHSKSGLIARKKCPVCAKSFLKHSDILSHIRSDHTKEGLYRCCVCQAVYQSYPPFKSHLDFHDRARLLKEAQNRKRQHHTVAGASKTHQSSSGVAKKIPRISGGKPVPSASKRKSQTPMQHLSLTNFQPPVKSTNHPTSQMKSARSAVSPRPPNTSTTKAVKTSTSKTGVRTPLSKLAAKNPPSSKTIASPIRKEVLASRLKPQMASSSLPSRKLPGNGLKPAVKAALSRSSHKTLPKATKPLRVRDALTKRKTSTIIRGAKPADKLWKCHFCERVFRTKGEYINHKKPSRITQLCKECGFASTSKALYIIHQYQKHTNRGNDRYTVVNEDLRCHICEEPIALNEVLNHVMNKHTGEHPYECCVCKKPSQVYEDWVSHGKSHVRSIEERIDLSKSKLVLNLTVKTEETVKNNELFCNLCKKYHSSEKDFIRHHKLETKKKECEVCRQTSFTDAGYLIHKYITHGLSAVETDESSADLPPTSLSGNFKSWHEDDVENDDNNESAKCPVCLASFPMKNLIAHVMNNHTQESPYKCCTCKASLSNLDQYMDHCDFHLGRKIYSRGTQRCLICGLRFESRIRLSRHKMMHKPTCSFCQMEFNSKALCEVHLKNFHTNEMTPCGFCGKLFAESNQLAEHERNHFFYKKSPCPICGINVANVNKHMARVHPKSGSEMQFLCTLCGQKFALKCDLSRHMSRHSNDRKHECDICKKTFKRAGGLRRHAQSHLQDRKFHECHICGKKCSQRNNLSVHMRVHSATKAYTCEHCGQGFNYNQSLQTHIRKKHNEESLQSKTDASLTGSSIAVAAVPVPPPAEPAMLNVRSAKPEPIVSEPMNQIVNNPGTQPNMVAVPPGTYLEHPVYQPTEPSQNYYPDPAAYVPVNAAAFQRSYTDLINTIVRSEHDNNTTHPGAPPQNYQVYYPQF